LAGRVKEARERGDYDAAPSSPEEAADFLAAIERLLGEG
jgi:hypothetical protein